MLRLDVLSADVDCVQFVLADPASKDFRLAGFGIKEPLSIGGFGERNGERPIIVTDVDD